jgi:hypothetical protein
VQVNPKRRLGTNGVEEIMQHPWFEDMDWKLLANKKIEPPMVPTLNAVTDTSNFANYDNEIAPPPQNTRNDRNLWQMWEWVETGQPGLFDSRTVS